MNPKDIIQNNFDRTLKNCLFYEEEGNNLALLNEIGVLRGLAYALEAFGECPHNETFIHFIQKQNDLK